MSIYEDVCILGPMSEPERVPLDPTPDAGHVKIYKDRNGVWCMGNKQVFFEFNNKDWFVFGFSGKTQLIGLVIGQLEYRITLIGHGLIHCVHVQNLMNREDVRNKLRSIDSFQVPLDHTTIPFFIPGNRTATL